MEAKKHQTIIVAPLDWGMGHATRVIPIIRILSVHYHVIVVAPKKMHLMFSGEPAEIVNFPGYDIRYYPIPLWISLVLQGPKVLFRAIRTKIALKKMIRNTKPAMLFSDNRLFVRSPRIPSVYMTHQLSIRHNWKILERLINAIHYYFINQFDTCWVPDTPDNDIAGELSCGTVSIEKHYIGALSRFQQPDRKPEKIFRKVCILSGPEPDRSIWANKIKNLWKDKPESLIIGALEGQDRFKKEGNITLSSHLNHELFAQTIFFAEVVVTRSGYTSIMDLFRLRKNAYLEPKKGQTEQEYLAKFHNGKFFKTFNDYPQTNKTVFENIPDKLDKWFCNEQQLLLLVKEQIDKK